MLIPNYGAIRIYTRDKSKQFESIVIFSTTKYDYNFTTPTITVTRTSTRAGDPIIPIGESQSHGKAGYNSAGRGSSTDSGEEAYKEQKKKVKEKKSKKEKKSEGPRSIREGRAKQAREHEFKEGSEKV